MYRKTSSGTATRKPSSTMATKKPIAHPAASSVRRKTTSRGWPSDSLKSAAWPASSWPKTAHISSAAARQKSGMPMTSGKSFAFSGQSSALYTPQPETAMMASARPSEARLGTFPRAPGLDGGIEDHGDGDQDEGDHHRTPEPRRVVARHRDVEVVLRDLAEDEAQHKRRARPSGEHHEVADRTEHQRHHDVGIVVVAGEAADEDQHQDHRHQQMPGHRGERSQSVQEHEAQGHGDQVGEHYGPHHRERHRQMLGQHFGPGNEAQQEEAAKQNRHRGAARHAEGDGGNERAALFGVARVTRSDHAAHFAFAEAHALLGVARALRGVAIGHPLRNGAAEARRDAD